jgi:hypothetical protein
MDLFKVSVLCICLQYCLMGCLLCLLLTVINVTVEPLCMCNLKGYVVII